MHTFWKKNVVAGKIRMGMMNRKLRQSVFVQETFNLMDLFPVAVITIYHIQ